MNFKKFVDEFYTGPSEVTMKNIIDYTTRNNLEDNEVAHLALCLAKSGIILEIDSSKYKTADIASTGGPSSLSTLICPLYLRSMDYVVPKLGVSGRPAGGIDVLAQIPGYSYKFSKEDITNILIKSGYVHFLASDIFAPFDAKLFEYRKQTNSLAIPQLVIASILAKKVAVGVKLAGLDIRVAQHGNFGTTWDEAKKNAKQFCRVADLLSLNAVCFLTDGSTPYQPYIGRGESLLALSKLFINEKDKWLDEHLNICFMMVLELLQQDKYYRKNNKPTNKELFNCFINNLQAQGSREEEFMILVSKIEDQHLFELTASKEGFLNINLGLLRDIIVNCQKLILSKENPFPDPCGVILKKEPGSYIKQGDLIATARISTNSNINIRDFYKAFEIKEEPEKYQKMEVIRE